MSLRAWGAWPLIDPNSSCLDDVVGDGGAVDLDEALLPPPALLVDEPGGQLLARPVLARDQDPAVGRGDPPDLLAEPPDGGALPDEMVAGLEPLAELDVLLLELALAEGVLDGQDDLVERERLLEKIEGAELGRLDGRLDRPVARDDHDLGPVLEALGSRFRTSMPFIPGSQMSRRTRPKVPVSSRASPPRRSRRS